jgi:hypothetical protein
METLLSITSFLGQLNKYWDDPAWVFAGLVGGIALLGLLALFLLYPISQDVDNNPNP